MLRRVLVGVAIVLLLVVGGAVGLFVLADPNWLKPRLEAMASETLGRQVQLGELDLERGWTMTLRAHDVRIANADWAEGDHLARVDEALLRLDLWTLLTRWTVALPEVALRGADVDLQQDAEGRANWTFPPAAERAAEVAAPEERAEFPRIGRITLADSTVRWRDAGGRDVTTRLDEVAATARDEGDLVDVEGAGDVDGEALSLDGTLGSWAQLTGSDQPYPVRVQATLGQTRLALDSTIGEPAAFTGVRGSLDLQSETLKPILVMAGLPDLELPPLAVKGQVEGGGQRWSVRELDARFGDSDLKGTASVDLAGERPRIEADLVAERLDADDFATLAGATPPAGPGEAATAEQARDPELPQDDGRVIPDVAIPARGLDAVDAKVRLQSGRITAGPVPLDAVDVGVELENGWLRVGPIQATIARGTVTGGVSLDTTRDPAGINVDLTIRDLRMQEFFKEANAAVQGIGAVSGRVVLKGQGRTTRELLRDGEGQLVLWMGEGRLSSLAMEALGLDAAEILAVIFGTSEPNPLEDMVEMRCFVGDFPLERGRLAARTLVLDTTDSVITGEGGLDVADETLGLEIKAHPKDTSIAAARSPIHVQGTLASPEFSVEVAPIAARGAAALALGVLLTPLAAILPFIDPGGAEDTPCRQLVSQATERAAEGN